MSDAYRFVTYLDRLNPGKYYAETTGHATIGIEIEKCIVANGCFDVLHPGHLHLLRTLHAIAHSRRMQPVVALNSDASVRALKGAGRPIVPQQARAELLTSLQWPFTVVMFDEDTPARLMKMLRPAAILKGGDIDPDTVIRWHGSEVIMVPVLQGWSTTSIVSK